MSLYDYVRIDNPMYLAELPVLSLIRVCGASQSIWERHTTSWLCLAGPACGDMRHDPPLPAILLWTPPETQR